MNNQRARRLQDQQGEMRQMAVDMLRLLLDHEGEIARIVDQRLQELLPIHAASRARGDISVESDHTLKTPQI